MSSTTTNFKNALVPSSNYYIMLVICSIVFVFLFACTLANGEVYWPNCIDEVTDASRLASGDFYDLCIRSHTFTDISQSWKFTKASIADTAFTGCHFFNFARAPSNFTGASWNNVQFESCSFGSFDIYGPEIVFDETELVNVVFRDCVFDHSIQLLFRKFSMTNVTFERCAFRGATKFSLGQMNGVSILKSRARRLDNADITSSKGKFEVSEVTMSGFTVVKSDFVHPFIVKGVNAHYFAMNDSTINSFACQGPIEHEGDDKEADSSTLGDTTLRSSFNYSILDHVVFDGRVDCSETTWRSPYFANVTFHHDGDFSRSEFEDMYVDGIKTAPLPFYENDCHTVNFSQSILTRKLLANVSIHCIADFVGAKFEQLRVKNFFAKRPMFQDAMFNEQEYIDGQCCSSVCPSLGCMCNVSVTSGRCPVGDRLVNITYVERFSSCFPGSSKVKLSNGQYIRMDELEQHAEVSTGQKTSSHVMFFGHKDANSMSTFMRIEHEQGVLTISPGHYLYVNEVLKTARVTNVNDVLTLDNDEKSTVLSVDIVEMKGMYAPMSTQGDLIVDHVRVSSYTDALHPRFTHRMLGIIRFLYRIGATWCTRPFRVLEQQSLVGLARFLQLPSGPHMLEEL